MKGNIQANKPEATWYTKYYEHDGMLRAYANRSMVLAMVFGAEHAVVLVVLRVPRGLRRFCLNVALHPSHPPLSKALDHSGANLNSFLGRVPCLSAAS